MILVLGPSTVRAKWEVSCTVHGHLGSQTMGAYGLERANCHSDEGCTEPIFKVWTINGRWIVHGPDCFERRSTKALALKLAQRQAS